MSQKILYVVWFLFPVFFFLLALWSKLEQIGGKKRQEHPEDFVKQGAFILACVLLCIVIDYYFLVSFHALLPSIVPLALLQVLLLPFILLVVAKLIGPTKDILISKAPNSARRKSR